MDTLAEALKLAELGLPVFNTQTTGIPWRLCNDCADSCIEPKDKELCECLMCHGLYAATTDVTRVQEMWDERPVAGVAIRTGTDKAATGRQGIAVLDFDVHAGGADGLDAYRRMKAEGLLGHTVAARTGGGGVHLYFLHPWGVQFARKDLRDLGYGGVDLKHAGGFVVAPPTWKPGARTAYTWAQDRSPWETEMQEMSAELVDLLMQPTKYQATSQGAVDGEGGLADLEPSMDRLRASLLRLECMGPDSGRNNFLYYVARLAGECAAAGWLSTDLAELLCITSADEAGLSRAEAVKTFKSGFRTGLR